MRNILIVSLFILTLFLISGCTQKETKYICPDGTTVSDPSFCKKQESVPIEETETYCGDGTCQSDETYAECSKDCKFNVINSIEVKNLDTLYFTFENGKSTSSPKEKRFIITNNWREPLSFLLRDKVVTDKYEGIMMLSSVEGQDTNVIKIEPGQTGIVNLFTMITSAPNPTEPGEYDLEAVLVLFGHKQTIVKEFPVIVIVK